MFLKRLNLLNGFRLLAALVTGGIAASSSSTLAHAATVSVNATDKSKNSSNISVDKTNTQSNSNISNTATKANNNTNTIPNTYTVKQGDTVSEIATSYGLKTDDVLKLNGLSWENSTIFIGQTLKLKEESNNTATSTVTTTTSQAPVNQTASVVGNSIAEKAVNLAVQYANMGIPYVWGGSTPSGFDCSGLTSYIYQQLGINIGRNTIAQESHVIQKDVSQAQPGDLLFWGNHGGTYHVAIYIGNGKYVAAPTPGQNVDIETINSYFMPSFAGSVIQ